MPRAWSQAVVAWVVMSAAAFARADDEPTVSGRVVDARGRPVAGAIVAWRWTATVAAMVPTDPATTDDAGRFTLVLPHTVAGRDVGLLARSADGDWSGATRARSATDAREAHEAEIELERTTRWTARLRWPAGLQPTFTISIGGRERGVKARLEVADDGAIAFEGPPDTYFTSIVARELELWTGEVRLPANRRRVDHGVIELEPSATTRLFGKKAPKWTFADVAGASEKPSLHGVRGKWVLLYFWGHW